MYNENIKEVYTVRVSHFFRISCHSYTGRTISTLGRGSSMIVRMGEPKRVGGRGVDFNDTIILDPGFF